MKFVFTALAGFVVGLGLGFLLLPAQFVPGASSGTYHTNDEQFAGAVTLSGANTLSGATTLGTGAVTLSGLVTLSGSNCATAVWDPISFSSTSIASTSIVFSGSALGDILVASIAGATSTAEYNVFAVPKAAGSSTIYLSALPGTTAWLTGLNLVTSTVRVCKIK